MRRPARVSRSTLRPSPRSRFGCHVVRLIAEAIPGATIALDNIDPLTGAYRLSHNSALSAAELDRHFQRLTEVYQQNPIHAYIVAGGTRPVKISDLVPQRQIHHTEFYQDFFKPVGLEYQIQIPLPGLINALSINSDRDFAPSILHWLDLAADHIAMAHENARRFTLLENALGFDARSHPATRLTPRELEVLGWMREGKRNPEIAIILGISFRTVEKHVENILRKTHTETRTAAARAAAPSETPAPHPVGTAVLERE